MNRRRFLTLAAGAVGVLHDRLLAQGQPPEQDDIPYGESPLGLSNDGRDGLLYVPKKYKHGAPMPLLMTLHGFGGTAQGARSTFALGEEFAVIVIAPESRTLTWGKSAPGFDIDVRYLGAAYRYVSSLLDVDKTHVALGGQSDGADYAFAMGLAYGDTFNHLMIFSEGTMLPFRRQGKPRIFIGHGLKDTQMPIDRTSRLHVPELKGDGYDVTYVEYDGGHGVPRQVVRQAFEWFVADLTKSQP